jgi:thioredoxin 1
MAQLAEVTDSNFQAEVLESESPTLVDFWAPWCGPCRVVGPVLEEIAAEHDDIKIVKLNVDDNPITSAQFQVLSIPTMILFKNGAEAKKIIGAMPKRKIIEQLELAPVS